MTRDEALELLAEGHIVFSEEMTDEVCQMFGVEFPLYKLMGWEDREDALRRYGFVATVDAQGSGVDGLDLSYHLASAFGLGAPGRAFHGRGRQARANVAAIVAHLQRTGVE